MPSVGCVGFAPFVFRSGVVLENGTMNTDKIAIGVFFILVGLMWYGFSAGWLFEKRRRENKKGTAILWLIVFAVFTIVFAVEAVWTVHNVEQRLQVTLQRATFPFHVTYRKALMGNGYVEQIRNVSSKAQSVKVTFYNPTLNRTKTYSLVMDAGQVREIGHMEGWAATSGDQITLECAGTVEKFNIP